MVDCINNIYFGILDIYFIIITNKKVLYILFSSNKILGIYIDYIRLVSGRLGQIITAVIIIVFIVDFFPKTFSG
jgi:hypothetical protein